MKYFQLLFCAINLFVNINTTWAADKWHEAIIDDALTLYQKSAEQTFQKKLSIIIFKDQSQAASAEHNEKELIVKINTGLLQSKRLTPDSLRMTICHELGHLFAGAPRRNIPPEWEGPIAADGLSYHSSEGQADYYASLVCFRQLISTARPNEPRTDLNRAGLVLRSKCSHLKILGDLCLRTALAGMDFLNLVKEFSISCEKSDPFITPELIRDSYPERQCRLDTIINGARCADDKNLVLHFSNHNADSCSLALAQRPACWFTPPN